MVFRIYRTEDSCHETGRAMGSTSMMSGGEEAQTRAEARGSRACFDCRVRELQILKGRNVRWPIRAVEVTCQHRAMSSILEGSVRGQVESCDTYGVGDERSKCRIRFLPGGVSAKGAFVSSAVCSGQSVRGIGLPSELHKMSAARNKNLTQSRITL
jgi:hypothetical protein